MQNITTAQKDHLFQGGFVGVTITGETLDGIPVSVTDDDIIEGSLTIERNWAHGSTLEIGCADTSELIFELDNHDGRWSDMRWEGARLTVILDIDGAPLQAGIFTVDEPPRRLTTMQIRALDDMARFNRPYSTGITYPASLKQILIDACSQCNVTLHTVSFDNDDYVVSQQPEGDDITFHHIVAWVAELAGCNAWVDELARLQLTWYGESQIEKMGKALSFDGAGNYVEAAVPGLTMPLDVEFDIKVNSIPSSNSIIFVHADTGAGCGFYNGNSFILRSGPVKKRLCDLSNFKAGAWNNIKIFYDSNGNPSVLINGEEPNYFSENQWAETSMDLLIGKRSSGNYCKMEMASFRMTKDGADFLRYNFDEGTGSVVHDSAGDSDGTIYGAAWVDRVLPPDSLGPDDRWSYELAEADIEITGIAFRTVIKGDDGEDDEDVDYLAGTDDYALVIEDNPLLQGGFEAVLSTIYDKIGGFAYRPLKFETIGYPHLWPGDKLTKIIDAEGSETASIITNHLFKLNGKSTIEARGKTETVRGYATDAPFTPRQKRVLRSVARVEAARHTSDMEQAALALNELMVNSLGFYSTTRTLPTGAKITYTHDKPLLEESEVIWTRTELGFAWTDEGWNGGNPVWQYGVTADGSMIARVLDVVGIRAEWISIGPSTTFASGYDPSTKETPSGAQGKADAAEEAAKDYADKNTVHKVEIFSTGGLVFKNNIISTTLIARVYKGKNDVTDLIDSNFFRWTRISDDPTGDDLWNAQHYSGRKQITVTSADVYVRATFNCQILDYMEEESA